MWQFKGQQVLHLKRKSCDLSQNLQLNRTFLEFEKGSLRISLDRRHSITDVFRKTYAVFPNAINFSWVQDPLPPIVVKISQLNWAAAGFSKVSQNIRCTSGQSALATIEKFGEDACFALTNSRRKGKIFNQRGEFAIFYFCRLHRNRRWRRRLAGSRVRSFRFLILFNANLQRHGQQEARRSDATYWRFLQQGEFINNSAERRSSERRWQNNERTFLSAFVAEQKEKLPNRWFVDCMYSVVWAGNGNPHDCESRRFWISNRPKWRNHR